MSVIYTNNNVKSHVIKKKLTSYMQKEKKNLVKSILLLKKLVKLIYYIYIHRIANKRLL